MILTGCLGGFLSQHQLQRWAFAVCAGGCAVGFVLTLLMVKEERREASAGFRSASDGLWRAM